MKHFTAFIHFITTLIPLGQTQEISDTTYREAEIYSLLDQISKDSILQLEWLTAMHFHKMINDYRNATNLKSMYWDHKLWMAARNHNVYLLRTSKKLTHSQSEDRAFFSGKRPQDRVNYVTYNSNEFELAGFENCNFSGYDITMDSLDREIVHAISLNKMMKIAKSTAEKGFEIWKTSSGHNKNMLNPKHLAHGTSFIFGKEGFYGTSVFANTQGSYSPDSLFLPLISEIIPKKDFKVKSNYHLIAQPKDEFNRITYKYLYLLKQFFHDNAIQTSQALLELSQLKALEKDQKQLHKAYRKARGIKGFFELMVNEVYVKDYYYNIDINSFKHLEGVSELTNELTKLLSSFSTQVKYWGGDIRTVQKNDKVIIEFRLLLLKKKK